MSKYRILMQCCFAVLVAAALPDVARAELPDPVRAMVEAAIASGDAVKVSAVVDVAKLTNPDDADEVDALHREFLADHLELATAEEARKADEIRHAGIFERWGGKGEIGASRASGNSDNVGLIAGLSLSREGTSWSHKLRGRADYQRTEGVTTREQFFASYEPRYRLSGRFFVYGLAQYERDPFQGFSARYAVSGGLGYRLIDDSNLHLSVKAGPAYRLTKFVAGGNENKLAGLLALDFDWSITDRLTLTQDTNMVTETGGQAVAIVDSSNTSINLITGLEAKVSDRLTTRISYAIEYDSDPPAGTITTDTLTRFTLIYGF